MIHLFTSFVHIENNKQDLIPVYKKMLGLWVDINKEFVDSINIVTNKPEIISSKNTNIMPIVLSKAFCDYDYTKINLMSSQVGCWIHMLENTGEGDICIYLDPDAFMITDRLVQFCSRVKDHHLTRKRTLYQSDAGVSVMRNNNNTKKMLCNIAQIMNNTSVRCVIEHYYDKTYAKTNEFFIPWSEHVVMLRDSLCGVGEFDTIHGKYTGTSKKLSALQKELLKCIEYKDKLRNY